MVLRVCMSFLIKRRQVVMLWNVLGSVLSSSRYIGMVFRRVTQVQKKLSGLKRGRYIGVYVFFVAKVGVFIQSSSNCRLVGFSLYSVSIVRFWVVVISRSLIVSIDSVRLGVVYRRRSVFSVFRSGRARGIQRIAFSSRVFGFRFILFKSRFSVRFESVSRRRRSQFCLRAKMRVTFARVNVFTICACIASSFSRSWDVD